LDDIMDNYPEYSEIIFKAANRRIHRSASSTISKLDVTSPPEIKRASINHLPSDLSKSGRFKSGRKQSVTELDSFENNEPKHGSNDSTTGEPITEQQGVASGHGGDEDTTMSNLKKTLHDHQEARRSSTEARSPPSLGLGMSPSHGLGNKSTLMKQGSSSKFGMSDNSRMSMTSKIGASDKISLGGSSKLGASDGGRERQTSFSNRKKRPWHNIKNALTHHDNDHESGHDHEVLRELTNIVSKEFCKIQDDMDGRFERMEEYMRASFLDDNVKVEENCHAPCLSITLGVIPDESQNEEARSIPGAINQSDSSDKAEGESAVLSAELPE